jgi:hypothetical protein
VDAKRLPLARSVCGCRSTLLILDFLLRQYLEDPCRLAVPKELGESRFGTKSKVCPKLPGEPDRRYFVRLFFGKTFTSRPQSGNCRLCSGQWQILHIYRQIDAGPKQYFVQKRGLGLHVLDPSGEWK